MLQLAQIDFGGKLVGGRGCTDVAVIVHQLHVDVVDEGDEAGLQLGRWTLHQHRVALVGVVFAVAD